MGCCITRTKSLPFSCSDLVFCNSQLRKIPMYHDHIFYQLLLCLNLWTLPRRNKSQLLSASRLSRRSSGSFDPPPSSDMYFVALSPRHQEGQIAAELKHDRALPWRLFPKIRFTKRKESKVRLIWEGYDKWCQWTSWPNIALTAILGSALPSSFSVWQLGFCLPWTQIQFP